MLLLCNIRYMKNRDLQILALLLLVVLGSHIIYAYFDVLPGTRMGWTLTPVLPLPDDAREITISYNRNFIRKESFRRGEVNIEAEERVTTFKTRYGSTKIQRFYQEHLLEQGWRFLCHYAPTNPAPSCYPYDDHTDHIFDWFTRTKLLHLHPPKIEVRIHPPDPSGKRIVELTERWS